jgi:energy-coupling factor transport system substrate-specific component
MGYVIGLLFLGAIIGLLGLLIVRRDLGVAYVAIAGLVCGIVSAIISAPIAATVFGGVTGSGTDLLVAAFQQAGADLSTAVLQQGLLSDPIDKTVTFFIVFVLLQTLSRRFIARFPQGEKAVGLEEA